MWQFWIDRGGTFTDVVAKAPGGELRVHKLLSDNPGRYKDAVIQGIRDVLGVAPGESLPVEQIQSVRIGTTLATNALLERKGADVALVTTRGFRDAVRIGYQNRPNIFALKIELPEMLYRCVIEIDERMDAQGNVMVAPDYGAMVAQLRKVRETGVKSCAIVFMHGYKYPAHEEIAEKAAREAGFEQICVSHKTIPLMKFVGRADTTIVDAYLSPLIESYVNELSEQLRGVSLFFMQSNGGLCRADSFRGKDAILSGPAGGIVGAVKTATAAGATDIITFDMGGTSTDVAHYAGEYERTNDTTVSGVRLRTQMMSINTVAAGGGSVISFDGQKFRVGPESAGANPGPACYRRNGPLTITDCNVLLGRIPVAQFPAVFGPSGNDPLDVEVVQRKFAELAEQVSGSTGSRMTPEQIAEGCIKIAVDKMANAIKQVSTHKGHDPSRYTLACFGGAGGQHACAIAEALGITRIIIHPHAGVLSAYGIGLADISVIKERSVEMPLENSDRRALEETIVSLEADAVAQLQKQVSAGALVVVHRHAHIRYSGTDFPLQVRWADAQRMAEEFIADHQKRYGFNMQKPLIIERVSVEAVSPSAAGSDAAVHSGTELSPGEIVEGPRVVASSTSTTVVDAGWRAELVPDNSLVLSASLNASSTPAVSSINIQPDPIQLEIFNNLFMSIAEQMGVTLQSTSHSVNIKERLDFSCALFDGDGNLVANAPHIPVHLGSMGETVKELIKQYGAQLQPGETYVTNDPYNGGTHLPDVTVIGAYFATAAGRPNMFVAARGHHADIGGITPGSMPPFSRNLDEEGVLIQLTKIAQDGKVDEEKLLSILQAAKYPARSPQQNVLDLTAQVASVQRGISEIDLLIARYGLETLAAYMQFVQDNAEQAVRRLISTLQDGEFSCAMDNGATVHASIKVNKSDCSAVIDFTRSSDQTGDNLNAPQAICKAAVLYVFRTLVSEDIPLNAGCLKPLTIRLRNGSVLSPSYPAAVVAGNVETSQVIVDTIYGALGKLAGSQGTMNNFTFGDDKYQYYETICGGSGAGDGFDGASAVQTHMTNSRLTDPEVLEHRFPVLVRDFCIREGSGGNGKFRGGDGAIRKIQFLSDMSAAILSNRRSTEPFGSRGGSNAASGRNYIIRADGAITELKASGESAIRTGDTFVIETPGGGGFGSNSGIMKSGGAKT